MTPDGCVQEADGRCDARALFPPQSLQLGSGPPGDKKAAPATEAYRRRSVSCISIPSLRREASKACRLRSRRGAD